MRAAIVFGRQSLELEIDEHNLVAGRRAEVAPNVSDPVQAMREALEHPLDYPALRLALTPEDQVAVVVDEGIPQLAQLLVPLLEHIGQAHVGPETITLIVPPPSTGQPWLEDLPDQFQDVHIEIHQPADRRKLAYLATTKQGRRVYLNRTAVDAGQQVVLSRRRYDPCFGYWGAETALCPGLSDEATITEMTAHLHARVPGEKMWRVQREAREITWESGAPFFVQVIEGADDGIAHILAGPLESSDEGQRLLDARWRVTVDRPVDVVVAALSGDPARHSADDLGRALLAASRVVRPGGAIVLLSEAVPQLGAGMASFRHHEDPALALSMLLQDRPPDLAAGFMWATAAKQARLYLLSGMADDVAEELFTIPMQNAGQAQRLLTSNATCLLLPDAHKSLAVLA